MMIKFDFSLNIECIYKLYIIIQMDHDVLTLDRLMNKYDGKCIDEIKKLAEMIFDDRFPESYLSTELTKINKNKRKLSKLLKLPVIEQRSEEWYSTRNNLITASDMGQALGVGKFGNVRDFYVKKSGYEKDTFCSFPALEWGIKYEPVATELYEKRQHTKVHEFGLIQHPSIPFFGASPDGITEQGVMLEIKCPYIRKINGTSIVDQYFYQMQGQLEVCDLDVCDFLECEFKEYVDEYEFNKDWNKEGTHSKDYKEKGIIIKMISENKYIYSKVGDSKNNLKSWLSKNIKDFTESDVDISYYRLNKFIIQKVYRDKQWFDEKILELEKVWNNVIRYRNNKQLYDEEIGKKDVKKKKQKCLFVDDVDQIK
jgi:putative phage-type endonuclease